MSDDFGDVIDLLVEEDHLASATARSWVSAVRVVSKELPRPFDLKTGDIDKALDVFEKKAGPDLGSNTLAVYRSRFRRAIEAYRAYLEDPTWRPERKASDERIAANRGTYTEVELDDGTVAYLPRRPTKADADRIVAVVRALARD